MNVLVADDEVMTRNMLQRALEHAGYDVIVAEDGRQALDALEHNDCQLVIADWGMPNMDGIELCQALRGGSIERYVYVIMLTNHDRPEDVLAGLNAGADDFVTKPFNPQEIVFRLRTGERLLTLETAEMTIFAMARLAESRDPETGAHLERVRSYCRVLTEHLSRQPGFEDEIDDEYIRLIYQTSPLHDIGKVAIPDNVLLKPGRLTDEEFDLMKTHTVHGAATLEAAMSKYPNARFLRMARDIALSHHEKWDGSGYPRGRSGETIPLCGRVVALADVYDALRQKRVYKEAFTHSVARSMIIDDRGVHFDPDIVDAFVANEQQFIDIRQRFADATPLAA